MIIIIHENDKYLLIIKMFTLPQWENEREKQEKITTCVFSTTNITKFAS